MHLRLQAGIFAILCKTVAADFAIFEPGLIGNSTNVALSQPCVDALQTSLQCDQYLLNSVAADTYSYVPPSTLDTYCTASCGTSLKNYHVKVIAACANDPYPWPGTPAVHYGDEVWAKYNMTCLKDSSGQYCQSRASHWTVALNIVDFCRLLRQLDSSECRHSNYCSTHSPTLLPVPDKSWDSQPGYSI